VDYLTLQNDVRDMGRRVAATLRSVPDGSQPIKGLQWTVADLGAHLVTVTHRDIAVARGEPFEWDPGDSPHTAMATFNDSEIDNLGERDPKKLADLLEQQNETLLDAFGPDGERLVSWRLYESRAQDTVAVWFGELLVHGLDLARTLGRPWPVRPEHAAAVIDGLVPALPVFVHRDRAKRAAGNYHVHLRGHDDYGITVRPDGTVAVTRGKPARADLHISANPAQYLLVGYGRANQWLTILRGAIVAWGRKPWLSLRFATIFDQP
jgi:uncharacterized protein (TIGR03083 family)